MMSLNDNEKDFQKKLQEETEIPVIVHERLTVCVYFRACDSQTICRLGICGVIFCHILSRLSIFR